MAGQRGMRSIFFIVDTRYNAYLIRHTSVAAKVELRCYYKVPLTGTQNLTKGLGLVQRTKSYSQLIDACVVFITLGEQIPSVILCGYLLDHLSDYGGMQQSFGEEFRDLSGNCDKHFVNRTVCRSVVGKLPFLYHPSLSILW